MLSGKAELAHARQVVEGEVPKSLRQLCRVLVERREGVALQVVDHLRVELCLHHDAAPAANHLQGEWRKKSYQHCACFVAIDFRNRPELR